MLTIDGSQGEGGGQILRTALSLSLATGTPFHLERIRARRAKPGLLRQHLTAVEAARRLGSATVEGAALGSRDLTFSPGPVVPGEYRFAIGSAGSTSLVLQTLLPPLLVAGGHSEVFLEGGTHNPLAPTFEFLDRAFVPLLRRVGGRVQVELERPGFYPAGGGRVRTRVEPSPLSERLELPERGEVLAVSATAVVSRLPRHIAVRELEVLRRELDLPEEQLRAEEVPHPVGPGNVAWVEVASRNVTELFAGFGERGVPAEAVAGRIAQEVEQYLAGGAPVGPHLADQLLLPLALGEGGRFRTVAPSGHTLTNAEIVKLFLPGRLSLAEAGSEGWLVEIEGAGLGRSAGRDRGSA